MSRRIRGADATDPSEIESALETGFTAMIGLEAELSRLRPRSAPADETSARRISELQTRITELRDALTELRALTVPPGEAPIGFGFVLPTARRQRQP